jgi:hypothetical protein
VENLDVANGLARVRKQRTSALDVPIGMIFAVF